MFQFQHIGYLYPRGDTAAFAFVRRRIVLAQKKAAEDW